MVFSIDSFGLDIAIQKLYTLKEDKSRDVSVVDVLITIFNGEECSDVDKIMSIQVENHVKVLSKEEQKSEITPENIYITFANMLPIGYTCTEDIEQGVKYSVKYFLFFADFMVYFGI